MLDAWNKHITIVKDYDQCVYQTSRFPRKTYRPGTNMINSYERQLTIVPEITDTMDPGETILVVVKVVIYKDTF